MFDKASLLLLKSPPQATHLTAAASARNAFQAPASVRRVRPRPPSYHEHVMMLYASGKNGNVGSALQSASIEKLALLYPEAGSNRLSGRSKSNTVCKHSSSLRNALLFQNLSYDLYYDLQQRLKLEWLVISEPFSHDTLMFPPNHPFFVNPSLPFATFMFSEPGC